MKVVRDVNRGVFVPLRIHFGYGLMIVFCVPVSARDQVDGLVSGRGLTNMRAGRNEWARNEKARWRLGCECRSLPRDHRPIPGGPAE